MRVQRRGELEHFVTRRYGDFARLHKRLRLELPGKVLPPLPKKNKSDTSAAGLLSPRLPGADYDSDASSISSQSTMHSALRSNGFTDATGKLAVVDHRRSKSAASIRSVLSARSSPRPSMESLPATRSTSPMPYVSYMIGKSEKESVLTILEHDFTP